MATKKAKKNIRERVLSVNQYLSKKQLNKILKHIEYMGNTARIRGSKRAIIDELIINILAFTGMRVSELCGLNIQDVSLEGCFINISDKKKNTTRKMAIPSTLSKKIDSYVSHYGKQAEKIDPLLTSERGNRLEYYSVYSKLRKVGQELGMRKLHPDMFRHTFLLALFKKDLNPI